MTSHLSFVTIHFCSLNLYGFGLGSNFSGEIYYLFIFGKAKLWYVN